MQTTSNKKSTQVAAKRAHRNWAAYWSAPSTKSVFTYFATNTKGSTPGASIE